MQKVVRAGNTVVLDEKNPHFRNIRDGTVIKLDVSNGVYTMDMWICLRFSAGRDSEWSSRFYKPVRPAALCRGVTTESEKSRME